MKSVKISIIGAGSAVFSLRIISDICKTRELSGSSISLMDVDSERLKAVEVLAKSFSEQMGASLQIETTNDLETAVADSNFVINTALGGGHDFLEKMREIGQRNGYFRGIDTQEFNMVSDYYTLTNRNQLSYFLKIANTIKKLAPKAWMILAANPVFEGTTLIQRETDIKMVGFCHGHHSLQEIYNVLGLKDEEVNWQVAGVNHGIWLNSFETNGQNTYPLLDDWLRKEVYNDPKAPFDDQLSPAARRMYSFYGRMPVGDTIRNSSWEFHHDDEEKKKWYGKPWGGADSTEGWKWYKEQLGKITTAMKGLAEILEKDPSVEIKKILESQAGNFPEDLGRSVQELFDPNCRSGEQHVPFINAIENNVTARLIVNTFNNGTIKGIKDDVAVEVPALVDKYGIHKEILDPALPEKIVKWYLEPRILRMEWALEAFLKKDNAMLVEFLMRDPRTTSRVQAERTVREIAKANDWKQ